MKYFTDTLEIVNSEVRQLQEDCKNYPDNVDNISRQFSEELLEVQKLLTVEKYLDIKSNFYKDKFKQKIINSPEDSIIDKYGIGMSESTFESYLKSYKQQFCDEY